VGRADVERPGSRSLANSGLTSPVKAASITALAASLRRRRRSVGDAVVDRRRRALWRATTQPAGISSTRATAHQFSAGRVLCCSPSMRCNRDYADAQAWQGQRAGRESATLTAVDATGAAWINGRK